MVSSLLLTFSGKKYTPNPYGGVSSPEDYGSHSNLKDTIGVLLEFKEGKGQMTYYRNGQNLGVAF